MTFGQSPYSKKQAAKQRAQGRLLQTEKMGRSPKALRQEQAHQFFGRRKEGRGAPEVGDQGGK